EHGIDAQGSEGNILPGMIWDAYAVPTHIELKEDGVNVMEVIVYRNQPFVLPTKNGEDTTTLVNLSNLSTNGKKSEISVKEAKEKGYPTLRDLLVGQIEVYFD